MDNKNLLDVSWNSILKVVFVLFIAYILFLIKDILILILFALIISVLFNPVINFLERRRIPRLLSATLVYVLFFGFLGFSVYFVSLGFIPEVRQFAEFSSQYFEKIAPPLQGLGFEAFENIDVFISKLEGWLGEASSNIFSALFSFFGGVFSAIFIVFLAFFFSLEKRGVEKTIKLLFPKKQENLALSIWSKSQKKISGWFAARILCCIFVGLAIFIALKLFKVDYALSLSLFAGIMNIIPYLGPIFAAMVITVLVFLESWLKGIFVLIAFILIQQIEENILYPVLAKKFIGLPPALVLISFIIGGQLWGFLGMVLAIPLAGIMFEFIKDYLKKKKERENSSSEKDSSKAIVM